MDPGKSTGATSGTLSAVLVLKDGTDKVFNLHGFRVCGARNCKQLFCGRLGRCPFHAAQFLAADDWQRDQLDLSEPRAAQGPEAVDAVAVAPREQLVCRSGATASTAVGTLRQSDKGELAGAPGSRGSAAETSARPTVGEYSLSQGRGADYLSEDARRCALKSGAAVILIAGGREGREQELCGPAALRFWEAWRATSHAEPSLKRARFKRAWSLQEHARFLEALRIYGKGKWRDIAAYVGTRSAAQCQSHAQKFYDRAFVQLGSQTDSGAACLGTTLCAPSRTSRKRSIHDMRDPHAIHLELARQRQAQQHRAERDARRTAAQRRKLLDAEATRMEAQLRSHLDAFVREHAEQLPTKRIASNMRRSVQKCIQDWKHKHLEEASETATAREESSVADAASDDELVPLVFMVPEEAMPAGSHVVLLRKPIVLKQSSPSTNAAAESSSLPFP